MRLNFSIILILLITHHSSGQTAKEIIQKAEEKWRGTSSSQSDMTIEIIRPSWSRKMSLKSWSKGESYSMILITDPAKEKGIVFLKRNKEVWNWIPSIERTIKLPPSMMTQSWMGTDLTNDDLVKESSVINDYDHTIEKDSIINGKPCYKIKMIPKKNAAVVWGMVISFVDKKEFIQLRAEMYDEDGYLVNMMIYDDIKLMGGKLIPTKMEIIPVNKNGQKTIVQINDMKFDYPIEDNFFSTRQMRIIK